MLNISDISPSLMWSKEAARGQKDKMNRGKAEEQRIKRRAASDLHYSSEQRGPTCRGRVVRNSAAQHFLEPC